MTFCRADVVGRLQPGDQAQAGVELAGTREDLRDRLRRARAGRLDELDAEGAPVEADRVPAAHVERHLLVDRAVLVDHEVGRDSRQLTQCGRVRGEDVVRGGVGRRGRVVQHDRLRMQDPRGPAVVALAEGGHLGLALRAVGDEVLDDRRGDDLRLAGRRAGAQAGRRAGALRRRRAAGGRGRGRVAAGCRARAGGSARRGAQRGVGAALEDGGGPAAAVPSPRQGCHTARAAAAAATSTSAASAKRRRRRRAPARLLAPLHALPRLAGAPL